MDREQAKEIAPVLAAFAEGAVMECRYRKSNGRPNDWAVHTDEFFDYKEYEYRIKPGPREFWLDPADYEVWLDQDTLPVPHAIKVREVLE